MDLFLSLLLDVWDYGYKSLVYLDVDDSIGGLQWVVDGAVKGSQGAVVGVAQRLIVALTVSKC